MAALAFALLFFFTASMPVALLGGLISGVVAVIYFPLRARRRARAERR